MVYKGGNLTERRRQFASVHIIGSVQQRRDTEAGRYGTDSPLCVRLDVPAVVKNSKPILDAKWTQ